jgi:hypothetical protein
LVHFFEGAVTVSGQPLENRLGKFTFIPEGADLRTEQGRAEILLTPGVILRVGEKSAIRMVATALADTKVELLAGSAILESAEPADGTSVTLTYKGWSIHQGHAGFYRISCDPARVQVRDGEVEVAAAGEASVTVQKGMDLPLGKVLVPETSPIEPSDAFTDWADGRAQSISTDNAIAADIQDPANVTGPGYSGDAFTYFPLLGFPSPMSSLNSYGSPGLSPYGTTLTQVGFYSVYLPGYTYRPLMLRLPQRVGLGRTLYPSTLYPTGLHPTGLYPAGLYPTGLSPYSPTRIGTTGTTRGGTAPPIMITRPPVARPVAPPPAVHPVIIHK